MPRVIVIGAGIAGLLAARGLEEHGCEVTLLESAPRPGGRLATHRVGDAVFDIGAQFFTTKTERFAEEVAGWRAAGVAAEWFRGPPDEQATLPSLAGDDHPRFRGAPAMEAVADHLASGLDVRSGHRVTEARTGPEGWRVASVHRDDPADPEETVADALLCTAPVPESLALLDAGDVVLSPGLRRQLDGLVYEPTVAGMVVPRQSPELGARGARRLAEGPLAFVADNQAKGVSAVPAVTLHAGGAASRRWWADGDAAISDELVTAARPWLGGDAEVVGIHRWRYATPLQEPPTDRRPALLDLLPLPIAFAGDAFAGGRVEGAARSGWASAELLLEALAS